MIEVTVAHSSRSNHQSAVGYCLRNVGIFFGTFEYCGSTHRRFGLTKRNLKGIDYAQASEAEIRHGSRRGTNVEWIASGDQHHAQPVEERPRGHWNSR
jgi:hypothetical protein